MLTTKMYIKYITMSHKNIHYYKTEEIRSVQMEFTERELIYKNDSPEIARKNVQQF